MASRAKIRERLLYLADADLEIQPSALYHENSKVGRWLCTFERNSRPTEQLIASVLEQVGDQRGRYPYCRAVPLAEPHAQREADFAAVLSARRAERRFAPAPVSLQDFSWVLRTALGNTGRARVTDAVQVSARAYPSAGGLYPVQIYPIVRDVDGLARGIYHYDIDADDLKVIAQAPDADALTSTFLGDRAVAEAAALLMITAIVPRSALKYGERGFRYSLIETGHAAQNLLLSCTAADLAAYPIGGFVETEIETLLHIDGVEEIALYAVAVGTKHHD
ncbi:MAG: SagB/ThcOx family dehydrogenase [Acidobacteriota bacterium]